MSGIKALSTSSHAKTVVDTLSELSRWWEGMRFKRSIKQRSRGGVQNRHGISASGGSNQTLFELRCMPSCCYWQLNRPLTPHREVTTEDYCLCALAGMCPGLATTDIRFDWPLPVLHVQSCLKLVWYRGLQLNLQNGVTWQHFSDQSLSAYSSHKLSCMRATYSRYRLADSISRLNAIPQEVNSTASANDSTAKRQIAPSYLIGVQNTIVGPSASLCCKRLSALVHTKPFSMRSRALKLLRFEFCIHVTSRVSFWPEKDSGNLCTALEWEVS